VYHGLYLLYFLVPKYLLQKKIWHFLIGFLILVLVCVAYTMLAKLSINADQEFSGVYLSSGRNVLPFIHVGGIAASIKLLKYWYLQEGTDHRSRTTKGYCGVKAAESPASPSLSV
jgi:hypothetical protein